MSVSQDNPNNIESAQQQTAQKKLGTNDTYHLMYEGREVTVKFKKPTVGQLNDVFDAVVKVVPNQPVKVNLTAYAQHMVVKCFEGLPFEADVDALRNITDYEFYLELCTILNNTLPMDVFLEKIVKIFSNKPLKLSDKESHLT